MTMSFPIRRPSERAAGDRDASGHGTEALRGQEDERTLIADHVAARSALIPSSVRLPANRGVTPSPPEAGGCGAGSLPVAT